VQIRLLSILSPITPQAVRYLSHSELRIERVNELHSRRPQAMHGDGADSYNAMTSLATHIINNVETAIVSYHANGPDKKPAQPATWPTPSQLRVNTDNPDVYSSMAGTILHECFTWLAITRNEDCK